MAAQSPRETLEKEGKVRIPFAGMLIGLLALLAFIVLTVTHLGELHRFVRLVRQAEPGWLFAGVVLQLATYVCAGLIWRQVARSGGFSLPVRMLARLAVEKLSIDQLLPTAGMSGSLVVMRAMTRRGVAPAVAMAAVVVDAFTYYLSFAVAAVATVLILAFYHEVTPVVVELLALFSLVVGSVPLLIRWLLRHRDWRPPPWLARRRSVSQALASLSQVSPGQMRSPVLILQTTALHVAIFALDGATLWTMLQVTGTAASPLTAFSALVMGSIAAAVSFLPGGIGGFEVGCTTTLTLLGLPIEAALTATLLLRGFTLWLPLLPGLLLARRDMLSGSGRSE